VAIAETIPVSSIRVTEKFVKYWTAVRAERPYKRGKQPPSSVTAAEDITVP
jgi:hypothetical protein